MTEQERDAALRIRTAEIQQLYNAFSHYNRYEPTPYDALDQLFEEYVITAEDMVIDFGCGKGRLNFYVHDRFGASAVGIEMNGQFYQDALENLAAYSKKAKRRRGAVEFVCCYAEQYEISPEANVFYFFNPFSVQIFMKVVGNILRSVEKAERPVDIVLYYPEDDYREHLERRTPFRQVEEIRLRGLYEKNKDERFVIYRLEAGKADGNGYY
ncbi:class I SAM-dependent methyltransferase [Exiguobacterium flavidum]|uniref:class I SAM-dependent methyltransferase n=1 Tax=Exiguobacterium flavidum TaxID=2184695 RepID=UPI000DF84855|nr:class I SAM-dependent methyltransferase [Exiguobacterium flavidum]